MTDARLRGEWLTAPAHDALTDAAYRVLHNALMHSAEQGTDGAIARREIRFLYPGAIPESVLDELVAAGFWEATTDGYQLLGWSEKLGQSTAAEVEHQRARNRAKQARLRARRGPAGNDSGAPVQGVSGPRAPGDVTGYATGDVTRSVGQDRTGQVLSLTDVTTTASQSRQKRARDVTDAPSTPFLQRRAERLGLLDVSRIADQIREKTGRDVGGDRAIGVAEWVLAKAKTPPRAPQRYVLAAITRSPFEIQQHIDGEAS